MLGYSFTKLTGNEWNEPKEITYKEYLRKTYLWEEGSVDDKQLENFILAKNPFGEIYFNANILEIRNGSNIIIELDDQTTTESVEHQIKKIVKLNEYKGNLLTEEEVIKLRRILNQTEGLNQIGLEIKFIVMTFKKSDLKNNSLPISLPNLFLNLSYGSKEPIDSLNSNDNMILWTTNNELKYYFG